MPIISVVMPVYNAERYLAVTIESILNQTYSDFELIAVNDGSEDNSAQILETYQQRDKRLRVHHQPQNMGIGAARTMGCQLAKGEYIAQMDSDDVSLPNRLARQVEYLQAHPEIGGCGTWIQYINRDNVLTNRKWQPATEPTVLRWSLLFGMQIAHPTWMMRRDLAQELGFYRSLTAEDYDLVIRVSHVAQIANVPKFSYIIVFGTKVIPTSMLNLMPQYPQER